MQLAARVATARTGSTATRAADRGALAAALADARRRGLVALELEARLGLAEAEPSLAAALAGEARARGYLALAAQAERLPAR